MSNKHSISHDDNDLDMSESEALVKRPRLDFVSPGSDLFQDKVKSVASDSQFTVNIKDTKWCNDGFKGIVLPDSIFHRRKEFVDVLADPKSDKTNNPSLVNPSLSSNLTSDSNSQCVTVNPALCADVTDSCVQNSNIAILDSSTNPSIVDVLTVEEVTDVFPSTVCDKSKSNSVNSSGLTFRASNIGLNSDTELEISARLSEVNRTSETSDSNTDLCDRKVQQLSSTTDSVKSDVILINLSKFVHEPDTRMKVDLVNTKSLKLPKLNSIITDKSDFDTNIGTAQTSSLDSDSTQSNITFASETGNSSSNDSAGCPEIPGGLKLESSATNDMQAYQTLGTAGQGSSSFSCSSVSGGRGFPLSPCAYPTLPQSYSSMCDVSVKSKTLIPDYPYCGSFNTSHVDSMQYSAYGNVTFPSTNSLQTPSYGFDHLLQATQYFDYSAYNPAAYTQSYPYYPCVSSKKKKVPTSTLR